MNWDKIGDAVTPWIIGIVWTGIVIERVYKFGKRRAWWGQDRADSEEAEDRSGPPRDRKRLADLGRRVLQDRFRTWPQIYLAGTETEPVVTLKARYRSPASVRRASAYAVVPVMVLGGLGISQLQVPPPYGVTWWEQNWLAVAICGGIAFVVGLVLEKLFRLMPGPPLEMTFQGGGIAWGRAASLLDPRWLDKLQFWRADPRGVVLAGEQRKAEKYFPHRKAADEQRKDDKRRQKRAQQGKKTEG